MNFAYFVDLLSLNFCIINAISISLCSDSFTSRSVLFPICRVYRYLIFKFLEKYKEYARVMFYCIGKADNQKSQLNNEIVVRLGLINKPIILKYISIIQKVRNSEMYNPSNSSAVSILSILILILKTMEAADCNFTHFQFYGKYSLGKQDELNRTFDQILPSVKVPTINYTAIDSSKFIIQNVRIAFNYIDSKQKAVIIGKDTVAVYGGYLETTVKFDWVKQNMIIHQEGTAQARILSQQILFQKQLLTYSGYMYYRLAYYYNVSFQTTNFTITRVDPPSTPLTDIQSLSQALNSDKGGSQSAKSAIQRQIANVFGSYLANNLKNQHYPLDDHFEYVWNNPWTKKNYSIPFLLIPTGVDLEQTGLSLNFVSYIKDYAGWVCGKAIPSEELNPSIYGGLQQFISFSVFQNTIKYALEKGILNTDLNRLAWQSRLFQFFAGDLYQIIPSTSSQFQAQTQVTGSCQSSPQSTPQLTRHNTSFLNSSTTHTCKLQVQSTKVAQFQIKLKLQIQIVPNETNINFKIVHAEGIPLFRGVSGFQVKNLILAEKMVMHSLNRLKEGWTFGSGWKIYPRDYTHVLVEEDYIVIYDSTHVQA